MANLVLKNNTSGGKTSVTADNFVGNASTASKWLTARTLSLAGDASGSVSIDGNGDMTLTVAVADSSHNHAASNITSGTLAIARIPTITIAKGGTGATDAATARSNLGITPANIGAAASSHTHNYQPVESTTFSISNTTYVSVRTPNRTASMYYEFWDSVGWAGIKAGAIYDNNNRVYSAGNKPSPADIGAAAASHSHSGYASSSHGHTNIGYLDTRADNQSPGNLVVGLSVHLKTNGTDGLSDGGTYHPVVGIKDWGDYSGGPYGQLTITANQKMWFRASTSNDAWGAWRLVLDNYNYSSYTVPKSGGTMTGTLNIENHTQNGSYDALLRVAHHSNNEWGVVIDKNNAYDWGLSIKCGQGNHGLDLNGGLLLYDGIGYGTSFPSSPAVGRMFLKI